MPADFRIPRCDSPVEIRQAFQRLEDYSDILMQGTTGQVLIGQGVGVDPVWTTDLTALTSLTVDNITINAATITSDTGAIGFGDENLSTTGSVTAESFITGTLTVDAASITDSSGAISFGDENLTTTGSVTAESFVTGTLTVDAASITDSSGAISFGDENLTTTGSVTAESFVTGTLTVDAASITDSSGAISFGDENLTTTGNVAANDFLASGFFIKTGWPDTPGVTLSFDDGTETLTVTDGGSAYYYINGTKYTLGGNKTKQITATEGLWYFYFDSATLDASQSMWSIVADNKAMVAYLYWDDTNNKHLFLGYELHGYMDANVHNLLHYTVGSQWETGLLVADTGSETINVSAGDFHDEDLEITITDDAGSGVWDQTLSPAELPVLYRDGASNWRMYATTDKVNATDVGYVDGSNNLHYNKLNGTWASTAVSSAKYVAYWIIATNAQSTPVIAIMGQREDGTLATAQSNNVFNGLDLTGFPYQEAIILARCILKETGTGLYYTLEEVQDLRAQNFGGSITTPLISDHGGLAGLGDDDHAQYLLADGTRSLTGTLTVTVNCDVTGDVTAASFVTGTLTLDAASITDSSGTISFNDDNLTTTGTITGVNVTSGADPGHTHTGASLSSIDISDDTNLTATAPIVLTDDDLSLDQSGLTNPAAVDKGDYVLVWDVTPIAHWDSVALSVIEAAFSRYALSDSYGSWKNQQGSTINICEPVRSNGTANQVVLAQADSASNARVLGLVQDTTISAGVSGDIQHDGIFTAGTTAQWDAVTGGSGGLTPGAIYYLDPSTAGRLTTTRPTGATNQIVPIGVGIASLSMRLLIQEGWDNDGDHYMGHLEVTPGATDKQAILLEGDTNSNTCTEDGTDVVVLQSDITVDVNGGIPSHVYLMQGTLTVSHTAATVDASPATRQIRCGNFYIDDDGSWTNTTTTLEGIAHVGFSGYLDNNGTYTATAAGGISNANRAGYFRTLVTSTWDDDGAGTANNQFQADGINIDVDCTPVLTSGALGQTVYGLYIAAACTDPTNAGHTGTSNLNGIRIQQVALTDNGGSNFIWAICDVSAQNWLCRGELWMDSDNKALYLGAVQDYSILWDGTHAVHTIVDVGGDFQFVDGDVHIDSDTYGLILGDDTTDYTLKWNGSNAVHTITAGDFQFVGGDVHIDSDSSKLILGDATTDYTIGWDGSDAVHTITAGDFVFTGGKVGIGTAAPDGTLHIHTSSAGSVTANANYDDLVIEASAQPGMSFLTADGSSAAIVFGVASDNAQARIVYNDATTLFSIGTIVAGGILRFMTANNTEAMRLNASQKVSIGSGSPSANADLNLDGDGCLQLKERAATPTANAGYGKIYTKTTGDKLYFQDGAGTEHEIAFA